MASIYLDASALYLRWDTTEAVIAPDAERAVALLQSDGHEVLLVGAPVAGSDRWLGRLRRAERAAPPAPLGQPAWLIVGDRSRCGPHDTGLRTVLVGGGPPPRTGRGRCDVETADLHGAALAVIGGVAIS